MIQVFKELTGFFFFVLNVDDREDLREYYLTKVQIKDYNIMNDGRNIFDKPIGNNLKIYENILEKLLLVKKMTSKLVIYQVIYIYKKADSNRFNQTTRNTWSKLARKKEIGAILRFSSNMIGNSIDEANFLRKSVPTS